MSWIQAWRAYDDDTLTALANAGLLRRAAKDVEAGKLRWLEQRSDGGTAQADGQQVQLDARGPQQARCDCPAPGMCKHILGAALWLRSLEPAATPATSPATESAAAPAAPDPLAEILALDPAALFKAAGAAAVRRAAAMASSTAVEWRRQEAVLVMELGDLGQSCRWVAGAGFAGMVSEVPARERKAVHLLALAALRSALGRPLAWPDGVGCAPAATADAAEAGLQPNETAFLEQVRATLHELLAGGLSHVGPQTSARLLALNMSARGEGLPRLAALLRNLGGIADLLVRRDHRAQERDALALLSQLQALCDALREARGELLAALRGRVRRDFTDQATLDLLPLGAHWWQTAGGARGLTLALWDWRNAQLLQAVLARPDGSDPGFTRHGAWSTQSLWPGSGAAERVCHHPLQPLRLSQPRLADDLRLALGGATRAEPLPRWSADDARLANQGFADWRQLGERLRAATGLTAEPLDLLLLRPSATREPLLDEAAQLLAWPVQDTAGRWLRLAVPVSEQHERRIMALQRLAAAKTPIQAVLVRVERGLASHLLTPVAVLGANAQGLLRSVSLDFEPEPARTTPSGLGQRILQLLKLRREARLAPSTGAHGLAGRLLAPLFEVLETQAATGRMALTAHQSEALRSVLPAFESVGWHTLAQALRAHLATPRAEMLLRLHRLATWLLELDGLE